MKVQSKLIASTLPILLIVFCSLGYWSFRTTKNIIRENIYKNIDAVLDSRLMHTFQRRVDLLQSSKMDKIESFIALYQQEAVEDLSIGADNKMGCFLIFDRRGNLVFSSRNCTVALTASQYERIFQNAVTNPSNGFKDIVKTADKKHIIGFRYFKPWEWILLYAVDAAESEKGIYRIFFTTLGVTGLCVMICALVLILVSRKVIGQPILKLKSAVNQIANRQTDVAVDIRTRDEFGDLAAGIHIMSKSINNHIMCLNQVKMELKNSNDALKKSEGTIQQIFDSVPDPIVFLDQKRRILRTNKAMSLCYGLGNDEMTGRYCYEIIHANTVSPDFCPYGKLLKSGKAVQGEFTDQRLGCRFEESVSPVYDKNHHLRGSVHVLRDITDRCKMERKLRQVQKLEAIGTLAGGIAHDLNNILAPIIGYTEIALADMKKGMPVDDYLHQIYSAGIRAKDLVKQILTFARQSDEERVPIRIKPVIKEAIKFLRSSLPASVKIEQNIISDSVIMGNATQLHQVVMNLCTNAAQSMEETGGLLSIELNDLEINECHALSKSSGLPSGNYIHLVIRDTGSGIAPDIMDSIFDPFFTTKAVGRGTGMGLAMVHGIVESYKGKIFVGSKTGSGSTFSIYLPAAQKSSPAPSRIEKTLSYGTERILFIDDEAAIANMGRLILEQMGYTAVSKTSSIAALELFRKQADAFDLIITDMTMPDMNGDRLTIELLKIRKNIPVILCTGYNQTISEDTAADIGIKAVVYKPIVKADLAKIIRKVLDDVKY